MSYGTGQYGRGRYGGSTPNLSISDATPVSTHVLRVTLTKEPQNTSAILAGDVLNPRTWKICRTDTNVGFNILKIEVAEPPLEWDIHVLEPFASDKITHTVETATLLDVGGSSIDAPRAASFFGVQDRLQKTPDLQAVARRYAARDLFNPQFATEAGNPGGVLEQDDEGDYLLHSSSSLVRKLILRRLLTSKGGFYHLPNYGAGIRVKEPLPVGDLALLQKDLLTQVKLEPEVEDARVSVTQSQHSLIITIRAKLAPTGEQIAFPINVPFGVQF